MLIFDRFPDDGSAMRFAEQVERDAKLEATFYADAERARDVAVFPFELVAPVVLVQRADESYIENALAEMATHYGGTFAGT